MKTNKKKLLSILTAFVMAFTVFGCTGMSFAEETTGDSQDVQTMGEADPDAVDETEAHFHDFTFTVAKLSDSSA